MRLHEFATGGDASNEPSELQGSRCDGTLADGYGNRFAGIPAAMKCTLHPFLAGHEARFFRGQVDAGLVAQAHTAGVFGDDVNAQSHAERVEENVAGLVDRAMDIDCAV